jgi:alpha-tubulin suppressor-like RCC1 family protein
MARLGILVALAIAGGAFAAPSPPKGPRIASVVLGDEHACALTQAGEVRCWGRNFSGQLGDGTRQDRTRPVKIAGLSEVAQLAAFGARTCAVKRDGTVLCWGLVGGLLADGSVPQYGQSTGEAWDRTTPKPVVGLSDVAQLAIGGEHLCALAKNGSVRCWGGNAHGQLGDGTLENRIAPTAVSGLGKVVQLALGVSHSCALREDSSVQCWGANEGGQLGDRTVEARPRPTVVPELTTVMQLAAGGSSTCARLGNGTVRCWGWNTQGQLGDGTAKNHGIPKAIYGLSGVRDIVLGAGFGCAIGGDRTVHCWGDNTRGQLADKDPDHARSLLPLKLPVRLPAAALAHPGQLEGAHACALSADGQLLHCWGRNHFGQLGRGHASERELPAAVEW